MNATNIKADINFLCGSTSGTYPDADKMRNVNIAYQDVARVIWESDGAWNFDDKNNTDSPVAYRSLANLSGTYQIPTTALRIEAVEVKDAGGSWTKLNPISYQEFSVAPDEYLSGGGMPINYWLNGNEIRLFPEPATNYVTMSSGMMVRLNRNVTDLATTATTATPGFAEPFHRILSYAAAIDFEQNAKQREFLAMQKDRMERGLIRFYAKRGEEYKSTIKPSTKRNWQSYI